MADISYLSASGGHIFVISYSGGKFFGGHVRDIFGGQLSAAGGFLSAAGGFLSAADNCPPIVRQCFKIIADKVHDRNFGGLFFGGLSAS